jgi:ATP/maltotriose-dependent transcriptional regulator MalT/DNA-binding SARP family transcriptional activator
MIEQRFNIVKITQPDVLQISLSQRLSERLKEASKCSLSWVSGPPGSGKTTCVSSFIAAQDTPCLWYNMDSSDTNLASFYHYLALACQKVTGQGNQLPVFTPGDTPELPEFSRNFFNEFFRNLNNKMFLVLDNYQEIPENIPLHGLLLDTLNFMPESVHIIIISRQEPSSKFSRLGLSRKMCQIDWQDLRFKKDEFQEVLRQWKFTDVPQSELDSLHEKMNGWIAGLHFVLSHKEKFDSCLENIATSTFDEIYKYFAEEIFNCQDRDIKQFLLEISVLPIVTAKHAQVITGKKNSHRILSNLYRNNFFVERLKGSAKDAYQFHPLFKEYLSASLPGFLSQDKIVDLMRRASSLLIKDNMAEEAANLLITAEDWDGLLDVIVSQAELLLAQGRTELLSKWLESIPPHIIQNNPWLTYWRGKSIQSKEPERAKIDFSRAFGKFCEEQAWKEAFAAWAGKVESIIAQWNNFKELDNLIEWFEKNFEKEGQDLSADFKLQLATCMLSALSIRKPHDITLAKWVEFCTEAAMTTKNVELSIQAYMEIADYYLWRGDQSNCWVLLGRIRNLSRASKISTLSVLKSKCLEANMYAWLLSDGVKCLDTIEQALALGRRTNIPTMNMRLYGLAVYGALIGRDYTRVADYLQKIEIVLGNFHQHNYFCHNYLSAWLSLCNGNYHRGIQHAKEALKKAKATGCVYDETLGLLLQAQILFEKGELQSANTTLLRFKKIIQPLNNRLMQYLYLLTQAQFSIGLGKMDSGLKCLRKGMKLGREENYQRLMCWWTHKALTRLCRHALDNDIEADYVRELIKSQGLVPDSPPIEIEQWPWPLRIYTFGRFEIVKDGKSVRSSGKAQQKPLAMLKALICLGGRGVAESNLANTLWQDAEGDLQHQALATTLHRLRRILGGKEMVEFNDGRISLNSRYCWVDTWAFERLLGQGEDESRKQGKKSFFFAARYAEKSIELYKGDFLPQNIDYWSIHMRERLKNKFLRGVSFLGHNLEKIGEQEKAIAFYLRALEIDPLVEEFYQRLMLCYHRMGRNVDAIIVFRRCLKKFDKELKISPSFSTQALYKSLLAKQFVDHEKINSPKNK